MLWLEFFQREVVVYVFVIDLEQQESRSPCLQIQFSGNLQHAIADRFGFQAAFGYWPDFKDAEDMKKLGAEAFAFVNVARFAVPLRIGLALGTTPWVQANIVDKFGKKEEA